MEAAVQRERSWLTVEVGLYLLLIALGMALRLWGLGQRPLSPEEADLAYRVWRFYQGLGGDPRGSPLLFHATALSFLVFGASDYGARLIPALAGSALVGLPYLLRSRLGRVGALLASALLAFSPSYIFFSRALRGEIIVAFGMVAFLFGLLRYGENRSPRDLYLAFAGLALSLVADSEVYTILIVYLSFVPLLLLSGQPAGREWRDDLLSQTWLRALALFGTIVVLASTGGLLNLGGLQAAIDLFPAWLSQWSGQGPWSYHLFLLFTYEPLILLLGLLGAGLLGHRNLFSAFFVYWFGLSLILYTLMGEKSPAALLYITLPLILLSGMLLEELVVSIGGRISWRKEGLYLALSLPAVVYLFLQGGGYPYSAEGVERIFLLFLALFFLACVLFLCYSWLGREVAVRGGMLLLCLVLGALTWRAGWRVNYGMEMAEPLLGEATSPDIRNLVEALGSLSNQRERDRHSIGITLLGENSALFWYLRGFPNTDLISTVTGHITTPVVITPQEELPLPNYMGQRFRLWSFWPSQGLGGRALLKWYLYREGLPPLTRDIIMWVSQT
ncbi:MAG: flippase activity-associated protein Agl23 [Anaerolineae bacterium]